jgi:soluble epoxide hydrolase/lipid-phosphate phosphatase
VWVRTLTSLTFLFREQYLHAAGPFVPVEALVSTLPRLSYQLFFDRKTSAAVAELNGDVRRTLRAIMGTSDRYVPPLFLTSQDSLMAAWDDVAEVGDIRPGACRV